MNIFKTKEGKIIIGQFPNFPIITSILLLITSRSNLFPEYIGGLELLAYIFLFIWAYLEVKDGVNLFRRILGIVVGIILTAYFLNYSYV